MNTKPQPLPSQESASLVKRLAGPSTGKAGLAKDQTEVNRIIAEASKGSKFYENEKKKDKDLTLRIDRILKQRDEARKGVDLDKVESGVDHLLAELESQRDLTQIIVHVDMDAFFANVELLDNPTLEGKPFGVGHGVLSTASYEARKYGVRSGMPGFIAKKLCPDLIFVSSNYPRYSEISEKVMSVLKRYDPNMSPAGCDEAYLNITTYCADNGKSPEDCVRELREKVFEETKLTASAGIAANKMLAKICSDKNKPNGQFYLPFDGKSILDFMRDLSIRKVQGIGRVNERLLESIGIKTCGDIHTHRATLSLMDKQFGLKFLLRTHLGIASNVVQPHQREERKSIGAERTFNTLGDKDKIFQKLDEVAAELEDDMERNGWSGRTVTLKFKLDTYQVFTRAKSFDRWITKKDDLFATGKELLIPELPLKLRLIGLRVTKLRDLRRPSPESGGIKRFFEPVNNGSPAKRRKMEHDSIDRLETQNFTSINPTKVTSNYDEDDYDEVMPGFHEHDEEDMDMSQCNNCDIDYEDDGDGIVVNASTSRPRPPVSAPARPFPEQNKHQIREQITHTSTVSAHMKVKPRSTGPTIQSSHVVATKRPPASGLPVMSNEETHLCPICGKTLETNNQGLNEHIDFCLSRGAILQAQGEASSPRKLAKGPKEYPQMKREDVKRSFFRVTDLVRKPED